MTPQEMYEKVEAEICEERSFRLHWGACADVAYGTDQYSEGIKRMCALSQEFAELTSEFAKRYYRNDSGTAYVHGEEELREYDISRGRMAGRYESDYGVVCIESNGIDTVMFFPFER